MRFIHVVVTASVLSCLSLTSRMACASDPVAEKLYQEGRKAVDTKDWTTACTKFRESYGREPAPGTLLNLANCEEMRGELAQSMNHFRAVASLLKSGDERIAYANQRADAVGRRVPKLTLRLQGSSAEGATVERDGAPVDVAALGTPVLVDPGEHVVVVRAPGHVEARSSVRLAEGESRTVELAPGAPVEGSPAPGTKAAAEPPQPTNSTASPKKWTRSLGLVGVGLGAAGIGLGVTGGLFVLGAKATVQNHCRPGCDPEGDAAQRRGQTWSTVGTVSFAVGLAAAGAGAALLLFGPKDRPVAVSAVPLIGGGAVGAAGTF